MNRSFCNLVLGILVDGQVNVGIPLRVTPEGHLMASVAIPTAGIYDIEMEVDIGAINSIAYLIGLDVREIGQTLSLNTGASLLQIYDERAIAVPYAARSVLSIGPESALTQTSGSVAIVRSNEEQTATLVVRSVFEDYESQCVAGSIMRFDHSSLPTVMDESNRIDSTIYFGEQTISNVEFRFRFGATIGRHLFYVPSSFLDQIHRTIESNGGRPRVAYPFNFIRFTS